jgi:iron complex outermembrane recepter protein
MWLICSCYKFFRMPCKTSWLIIGMLISGTVHAQLISGKITSDRQLPVANASVYLLNTNYRTTSDASGSFSLRNIAFGNYILSVSAVGFATVDRTIKVGAGSATHVEIYLADALKTLDEVVVTAQKREELLQNIPVSITSLSSKQIEQFRLWDSKDLTAIIPGLYSNNSGDERNVTSIRGIVTTSYDPAIATYVDGVNQFTLDTYIATLNDVERIEVLRGPQGTLYGRNAMGGVINIITKQPSNTTTGYAELTAGNYGLLRLSAGFRTPIIKNKLFFGVAGVLNARNGFYTNEFNNSSFDRQQSFAGNYYLKYIPVAKWDITANIKHQDNTNHGPFPLVNGIDEAFRHPFLLSQDAVAKMIDHTWDLSLSVVHKGHGFNFTSLSAWQTNYRYYNAPIDGDFSAADAVTIINNYGDKWNKVRTFTQELRFTSPGNSNSSLKWTAGSYFFYENNPAKQATHFGRDAALVGSPDSNFSLINTTRAKSTGAAVYGQISYPINKQLSITGGLRYDYENKQLSVLGEYEMDGQPSFVIQPDTSASVHYSAISPRIGLDFAATRKSNVYASYSRGYRTGGLTQLSSDPSQPPLFPYKPEYSNNIEAGIKNSLFQNRMRLNLALFYTLVTDAQVPTLILPDAITVTKNTGKLTSKGGEIEISSAPVKGLQVDDNFGYTDAAYHALNISQNGSVVDLAGNKQIFTPTTTNMAAVLYSFYTSLAHTIKITARGEWISLGKEYFDLSNTISQSPYSLFNIRFGISLQHFDLFVWGRNITNKRYIAYAYDFGAIHLGDPKTFGISLAARF